MNTEILNIIVRIVLAIVSVLITGYFIPYVKSKVDSTKYNDFLTMVEMCVEAANQLYTKEEWKEKKNYVFDLALKYTSAHGVDLSLNEIDALIEGFVIAIKEK